MSGIVKKREHRQMKSRMKELMLFIPNLVWWLVGLLRDDRISRADKAILARTIIYVISPLDIIPAIIRLIGQYAYPYLLATPLFSPFNPSSRHAFWDRG